MTDIKYYKLSLCCLKFQQNSGVSYGCIWLTGIRIAFFPLADQALLRARSNIGQTFISKIKLPAC